MEEENHNCIDLNKTRSHIEEFGLSVKMVKSTNYNPSFAYSVGLWERFKHPEIICFGLKTELLHELVNDVAELIKGGEQLQIGVEYKNVFENGKAEFLKIDERNIEDYFGVAIEYYGSNRFDGLQLIWTDRNNKFPWELNFEEEFRHFQPLLDRNAEFKFREEKNLGIFTTREWLENDEPIVRVVHEEDGDWQFLTKNIDFENGKLVSLERMILRDKTLNEVFDLEYGEEAERKEIGKSWKRNQIEVEDEDE